MEVYQASAKVSKIDYLSTTAILITFVNLILFDIIIFGIYKQKFEGRKNDGNLD